MEEKKQSFDGKLAACLDEAVGEYFRRLDGAPARKLYKMFSEAMDKTLLTRALFHAKNSRTEAAAILGISRATFARKLAALNGKPADGNKAGKKIARKKAAHRRGVVVKKTALVSSASSAPQNPAADKKFPSVAGAKNPSATGAKNPSTTGEKK
jgi:DNA-binding protein Fis